jgi:hypothetical protein
MFPDALMSLRTPTDYKNPDSPVTRLSPGEVILYVYLTNHHYVLHDSNEEEDMRQNGWFFWRTRHIIEKTGFNHRQLKRLVRKLKDRGLLQTKHRPPQPPLFRIHYPRLCRYLEKYLDNVKPKDGENYVL